MEENKRIALLIDSDNMNATYAPTIFEELSKYGRVTVSRAYGDFSLPKNGWKKDVLQKYSITPVQQFAYVKGKNATDMKMVIDAMDIMYEEKMDIMCLVTNDSDFTPITARIQEEGIFVIGMGTSNASQALHNACSKFVHLNLIAREKTAEAAKANAQSQASSAGKQPVESNETPLSKIVNYVTSIVNNTDDKRLSLGEIGSSLSKKYKDFDTRNYGFSNLSTMLGTVMKKFHLVNVGSSYYLQKDRSLQKTDIDKEVVRIVKEHGGKIDNLSLLYQELQKRHKDFKLEEFGFSRVSSFLKSVDGIIIADNMATLKK